MAFSSARTNAATKKSRTASAGSAPRATRTARSAPAPAAPAIVTPATTIGASGSSPRNRSRGEGKALIWTPAQDEALASALLAGNTDPEELLDILREDEAFEGVAAGLLNEQRLRLRVGELRRHYEGVPSLDKRPGVRYNPGMNKELGNLFKPKRVGAGD